MVGGFEKLAPFSFTEVFAVFVEGFNMRLILNRSSQFMKRADEALASLSSTSRVISYRHGNALVLSILVKNRGEENTDGAVGWLVRVIQNSALSRSPAAIWYKGRVIHLHRRREVMQNIGSYHITTVPAKNSPRRGVN